MSSAVAARKASVDGTRGQVASADAFVGDERSGFVAGVLGAFIG